MPHLKALVERHEDDPFELIGINTNDSPEVYRAGLEEHGVSWLSAYQGQTSPIASLYGVSMYPTYLVIDVDGTIAYRGSSGQAIDAVIEKLVQAAKKK
jgi:hypothetical protein